MSYRPTIGLEVHAELKTNTKMFCNSTNDPFHGQPNSNICPVCLAHPGTLPVINREAVRHVLRVGLALKSRLADYTEFDRKNYFYPDQPKGYQLSQYAYPLVEGGELRGVAITRVHLEEDTASSSHEEEAGTLVDYNRAGVPLMELVTEPVITTSTQAGEFARELQLLLKFLGASDANMERGEMRVEANVSVGQGQQRGTKVEVKNLNSFRSMERAIEFEIRRQESVLTNGGSITQETRGWDEVKQQTFPQRLKEGSADYRYFPDPDLPSLRISEIDEFNITALESEMPETPEDMRARYLAMGVKGQDVEGFLRNPAMARFFEKVVENRQAEIGWMSLASNYISNDLASLIRDNGIRDTQDLGYIGISSEYFTSIIDMLSKKKITTPAAKEILASCFDSGIDPKSYAKEHNLISGISSADLEILIETVLKDNTEAVNDYKGGKIAALQYIIGLVMKSAKGRAEPSQVREMTLESINGLSQG